LTHPYLQLYQVGIQENPERDHSMSQWEYRFVVFQVRHHGGERHVAKVDEKLLEGWETGQTPNIADYSRTVGEEGWELIFFDQTQGVFKRPKKADANVSVGRSHRVY